MGNYKFGGGEVDNENGGFVRAVSHLTSAL